MKIIFLNLSDKGPLGEKSAAAIEKSGAKVEYRQLLFKKKKRNQAKDRYSKIEDSREHVWLDTDTDTEADVGKLSDYRRIIIAAHGELDDREFCYYADDDLTQRTHKLLSASDLANLFVKLFFDNKKETLDSIDNTVTLSICFAGRADNKSHHEINFDQLNFKNSFLYKFSKQLHQLVPTVNFLVEGFIGRVRFNQFNGDLEVQTEAQLETKNQLDAQAKAREVDTMRMNEITEEFLGQLTAAEQGAAIEEYTTKNPQSELAKLQNKMIDYIVIQSEARRSFDDTRPKEYGKIAYQINAKGILLLNSSLNSHLSSSTQNDDAKSSTSDDLLLERKDIKPPESREKLRLTASISASDESSDEADNHESDNCLKRKGCKLL